MRKLPGSRSSKSELGQVLEFRPRDPIGTTARLMDGHDPAFDTVFAVLASEMDDSLAERYAVLITLALDESELLDPILAAPH